jgi:hypothetical protein
MAKRLKSNKDIVKSVGNEIAQFVEDRMMKEYPGDVKYAEIHELPHAVKTLFEEFVCEHIETRLEVCKQCGETVSEDDIEIIYKRGVLDGETVWSVGIFDMTLMHHPNGYEFFARDNGAFVGWMEG